MLHSELHDTFLKIGNLSFAFWLNKTKQLRTKFNLSKCCLNNAIIKWITRNDTLDHSERIARTKEKPTCRWKYIFQRKQLENKSKTTEVNSNNCEDSSRLPPLCCDFSFELQGNPCYRCIYFKFLKWRDTYSFHYSWNSQMLQFLVGF